MKPILLIVVHEPIRMLDRKRLGTTARSTLPWDGQLRSDAKSVLFPSLGYIKDTETSRDHNEKVLIGDPGRQNLAGG